MIYLILIFFVLSLLSQIVNRYISDKQHKNERDYTNRLFKEFDSTIGALNKCRKQDKQVLKEKIEKLQGNIDEQLDLIARHISASKKGKKK